MKKPLKNLVSAAILSVAAVSMLPSATAHAANALVTLPDVSSVVAKTESAVVNIRTFGYAPQRRYQRFDDSFGTPFFPFGDDPDEFFNFFFGHDPFAHHFGERRSYDRPHGYDRDRYADRDDHRDKDYGKDKKHGDQAKRYDKNYADKKHKDKTPSTPLGLGSGFIVSADGYIITNAHVVDGADKILVTLTNSKEYEAKLVGSDQRTDIAVLKVEAKDLPFLKAGDTQRLKKGQWVLAIGSPFDLDTTVTLGIVSAINRDAGGYLPFIQTDVALNPGNSGGPLIDLSGEVVGVNSAIISRSGGYQGISLSIPIDEAMRVYQQIKTDGKVTRSQIGIKISEVSDEVAKAIGLPKAKGAMVNEVLSGSPAEKAGFKAGDVVLKFNNQDIERWSDLPRFVGSTKPDSKASVLVWRLGKELKLTVMPEVAKDKSKKGDRRSKGDKQAKSSDSNILGITVAALSKDKKEGVEIVAIDPDVAPRHLRKGDVLLALNKKAINSVDEFNAQVKSLKKGDSVALLVQRGKTTIWQVFTLD